MIVYAYIQPNSSKTEFAEKFRVDSLKFGIPHGSIINAEEGLNIEGNTLEVYKIKLKAPPVDNAANEELIKFLAKYYQVNKSKVEIKKGLKSRYKVVEILD